MKKEITSDLKIEVTKNGPYLVSGGLPLSEHHIVTNAEGDSLDYKGGKQYPAQAQYALCRCGHSANKPFCDGTHDKIRFDGTETASREPYLEQVETIDGPTVRLSPTRKVSARLRDSATRKGESGIWSNRRMIPRPGRLWNMRRRIVRPAGWWFGTKRPANPSNRNSNHRSD